MLRAILGCALSVEKREYFLIIAVLELIVRGAIINEEGDQTCQ